MLQLKPYVRIKYLEIGERGFTTLSSQFGYCPLVWMLHSRKLYTRINRIHERALRVVYNDMASSFDELLLRNDSVSIHIRNIQLLDIELYKVANGLSPKMMSHVFPLKVNQRYPTKTYSNREMYSLNYGTLALDLI